MTIYITKNGQTLGPFDIDTVNAKLLIGELSAHDLCWSEGAATWQPLSLLEGVQLPAPGTVPPPPPQVAPQGGFVPTGMPPLPPTSSPFPPPAPASYPGQQAYPPQQAHPPQQPYPVQPAYPAQRAPSSDFEEERLIFEVRASPAALSLSDLLQSRRYTLTSQRLTLSSGLLTRRNEELEIYRVRDVSIEQGLVAQMFGFGDVVVHASDVSSPKLVLRNVPNPTQIKEQIRAAARQSRKAEGVRATEYIP